MLGECAMCDACAYGYLRVCVHVCARLCLWCVCVCGDEREGVCVFSLPVFWVRLRQPEPLAGR